MRTRPAARTLPSPRVERFGRPLLGRFEYLLVVQVWFVLAAGCSAFVQEFATDGGSSVDEPWLGAALFLGFTAILATFAARRGRALWQRLWGSTVVIKDGRARLLGTRRDELCDVRCAWVLDGRLCLWIDAPLDRSRGVYSTKRVPAPGRVRRGSVLTALQRRMMALAVPSRPATLARISVRHLGKKNARRLVARLNELARARFATHSAGVTEEPRAAASAARNGSEVCAKPSPRAPKTPWDDDLAAVTRPVRIARRVAGCLLVGIGTVTITVAVAMKLGLKASIWFGRHAHDIAEDAEPLFLGLFFGGLLGLVLGWAGLRVALRGKRFLRPVLRSVADVLPHEYTLYLRAFAQDVHDTRHATAVRTDWLALPIHIAKTREEILLDSVSPDRRVVAVGSPSERLPTPGALRLYIDDAEWQRDVRRLIQEAELIVLRTGSSPGVQWEVDTVFQTASLDRVLLLPEGSADDYDMLCSRLAGEHSIRLPGQRCEAVMFSEQGAAYQQAGMFTPVSARDGPSLLELLLAPGEPVFELLSPGARRARRPD